jgi:hypothetical protein
LEGPVEYEIEVVDLPKRRSGTSRILVGVLATGVLVLVLRHLV